jgi:hypothetical protein
LYLRWWFPLQVSFRCSVNNYMLHNFLDDNVTSGRPSRNAVNERENRNLACLCIEVKTELQKMIEKRSSYMQIANV